MLDNNLPVKKNWKWKQKMDKLRKAERRVEKLERDLIQSRKATEKANKEKDEATEMNLILDSRIQDLEVKVSTLENCVEPITDSCSGFQGGSGPSRNII